MIKNNPKFLFAFIVELPQTEEKAINYILRIQCNNVTCACAFSVTKYFTKVHKKAHMRW